MWHVVPLKIQQININALKFGVEASEFYNLQCKFVTPHNLHITITIKVLPVSIQTWSFSKHS